MPWLQGINKGNDNGQEDGGETEADRESRSLAIRRIRIADCERIHLRPSPVRYGTAMTPRSWKKCSVSIRESRLRTFSMRQLTQAGFGKGVCAR